MGVIEIGRKSDGWLGALIFGVGSMEARFHWSGTVEETRDKLNKRAIGSQKTGAPSLRNQFAINNNNNNTRKIFTALSSCLKHCERSPWFTR